MGDGESHSKPFALPGSRPHYTPDRPGQVEHIRLDLTLDLEQQRVAGICQIRLNPIRSGITTLTLDAVHLDVQAVQVNQQIQTFDYDGKILEIYLTQPTAMGQLLTLTITYAVEQPTRGIYFIYPTSDYPDKPRQVWTQGEDEDSRFWFPCFDYPGQLATSEIIVTVANPYRVISNGTLISQTSLANGYSRYHWHQQEVHPTYLMTLAVGDFAEVVDYWREKPVTYYVEKNRLGDVTRSMGKTPAMIEFFSTVFGYPYPYPKYAQVCVADFIFGGMENTSATLLTDRCLLDERAALDYFWTESLVAHELAHQWFGDLLVIKHWSHAWIKEGMATYAETLWEEFANGQQEASYHRYQDQQAYLEEDRSRYRRPMVTHIYKDAIELYDCHIYQKGGCVYHMIRQQLGDDLFKKAIQIFVQKYAHQTVETVDLLRAIDQATGQNLSPLFDQYVFRGGHPDYKVSYSWDSETKLAKVTVAQTQGADTLFDLRIPIAFGYEQGKRLKSFTVRIQEAEQSFYFPLETKPEWISFDHGNHTLKTVELTYALPELKAQLLWDPDPISRILAAQAIAKKGGLEAVKALQLGLGQETFWPVRQEICGALGTITLQQAFAVVSQALADPSPQVRKAAIQALAQQKSRDHFEQIRPFLQIGDPSYQVEAAAATALGKIAGGSVERQPEATEVVEIFRQALAEKVGWNEVVRAGVVAGLAHLKDSPPALEVLLSLTSSGTSQPLRLAAIRALGTYASQQDQPRIIERLRELAREDFFFIQIAVVTALSQLKTPQAISILQSMDSQDGRISRRVAEAIRQVQAQMGNDPALQQLREELTQLKQTHVDLLSRLSALESQAKSPSDEATPA
ncbi:MAG: M1 family metallopeptidase [Cyanobacteriota bacterium]|nr:M1 family metallopeptidase [Cyanobacteriota bacterium]